MRPTDKITHVVTTGYGYSMKNGITRPILQKGWAKYTETYELLKILFGLLERIADY